MLAAWHASMDIAHADPEPRLPDGRLRLARRHRREALKLAAGFRGEEAVDRGVTDGHSKRSSSGSRPQRQEELAVEGWSSTSGTAGSDN